MKRFLILGIVALAVLIMVGCPTVPTIYAFSIVTDMVLDGSTIYTSGKVKAGGVDVACYWSKEGTSSARRTLLEAAGTRSIANTITISGATLYLGGYYFDNTALKYSACYWSVDTATRAVTRVDLPGIDPSFINGIAEDSGTIYSAGFYNDETNDKDIAAFWTGTTRTTISNSENTYINDTDYSGALYSAGYIMEDTGNTNQAAYWTGGALTQLETTGDSIAFGIFREATTTYTAGYFSGGSGEIACTWADTTRTMLDSSLDARAFAVTRYDSKTYAAGKDYDSSQSENLACFWIDGSRVVPTQLRSANLVYANSIAVSGGTVYITGNLYEANSGTYVGYVWDSATSKVSYFQ
jgi:hypothetical protein